MLLEGSGKEDERMARYVSITKSSGGFGEYDSRVSDAGCDVDDVLNCVSEFATVYELGVDKLPANVVDIRGRIHCQPARVFAADYDEDMGGLRYFGIIE
jgi:hypothetical protein